jgi:hypothetical protein
MFSSKQPVCVSKGDTLDSESQPIDAPVAALRTSTSSGDDDDAFSLNLAFNSPISALSVSVGVSVTCAVCRTSLVSDTLIVGFFNMFTC